MKTTILKEDVEKALEARIQGESYCRCCVLAQVLKRLHVPVFEVYLNTFRLEDGTEIPFRGTARELTQSYSVEWPSFIGKEIELPDL